MPVPPRLVRRLVIAPLVALLELALLVVSPVLLLVAALASPFFGGLRPLRVALIGLAAALYHLLSALALLGLWIASGFGLRAQTETMQRAHYAVMRWFVNRVYGAIVRLAHVEIEVADSADAGRALSARDRPVLVLARHAGEGDTLLVIRELLCKHGRGPRVVMHERLRLDPLIDTLGSRLPNRFVDPRGGDIEHEIAELAAGLTPSAALVIFPEGANFSEERRERSIQRLLTRGHHEQAEAAQAMRHHSAPRPGGTLAAIDAAPGADVVIMGHAGFPEGFREVWRKLPEPQTIEIRLWYEPAAAVPIDQEEQIRWLFSWWQRLDAWVDERTG